MDVLLFNYKLMALENNFKELIRARDILINDTKCDKETKKWAKQFMTEDIKNYKKNKNDLAIKKQAVNIITSHDMVIKDIINKRLGR